MSEPVVLAIFTLAGTILGAVLGPIFVARFSKTKRERDAALSEVYLKLADMTADQLEERINLIGKLDARIRELQAHRDERDRQIAELKQRLEKDLKETNALRDRVVEVEEKYNKQVRINLKLVQALEKAEIPLPDFNGDLGETLRGYKWPEGKGPR